MGHKYENFGTCWDQNCHLLGLLGTTTARQRGGFSWRVVSAFALQGTNIEDAGFAALIFKLLFCKDHFWRVFFLWWGGNTRRRFFLQVDWWLDVFLFVAETSDTCWMAGGWIDPYLCGAVFFKNSLRWWQLKYWGRCPIWRIFLDGLKPPSSFLRAFLKTLLFYSQGYKLWVLWPQLFSLQSFWPQDHLAIVRPSQNTVYHIGNQDGRRIPPWLGDDAADSPLC